MVAALRPIVPKGFFGSLEVSIKETVVSST
jgi:hypothetical protein